MVRVGPTWRSRSKELCLPTPAGEPGSGGCSDGCVRASEPACEAGLSSLVAAARRPKEDCEDALEAACAEVRVRVRVRVRVS